MDYQELPENNLKSISESIRKFDKEVKNFEKQSNLIGTPQDGPEVRKKIGETREGLITLSSQILSDLRQCKPSRTEYLIFKQLSNQFEERFEKYQTISEKILNAEKSVFEESRVSMELSLEERQSLAFQNFQDLNEELLKERYEEIKDIEREIIEVNSMFRDLNELVNDEQSMFDEAEANVEKAVVETGKANEELEKAENYERSSRNKIWYILIIVVVILAIVGVVVAINL